MKNPLRTRTLTVIGGATLIGVTGAGLASGANAATSTGSATSTLAKIKYCESGGNYQAVNSSSGASGAYQFLNSTWKGLSASSGYATAASAPASVQDAAALELYQEAGTSPWVASSSCWASMTSTPSTNTSTTHTKAASTASTGTKASGATSTTKVKPATKGKLTTHRAAKAPQTRAQGGRPITRPVQKPHGKEAQGPVASAVKLTGGKHTAKHDCPKPAVKPVNSFRMAA